MQDRGARDRREGLHAGREESHKMCSKRVSWSFPKRLLSEELGWMSFDVLES